MAANSRSTTSSATTFATGWATLRRYPVVNGDVTLDGTTNRLCWVTMKGDLLSVTGVEPRDPVQGVPIDDLACSGDVSFAKGHFHPNKPPGLTFLAVPAYFFVSHVERWFGGNLDNWWLLTINAWLTSVFSVGLDFGGRRGAGFPDRPAPRGRQGVARVLDCAGPGLRHALFFPFATLLFDHDVAAALLIAAFYLLLRRPGGAGASWLGGLRRGSRRSRITSLPSRSQCWAFTCWPRIGANSAPDGFAALMLYILGLLGPLAPFARYNQACYGSPFALSNHFPESALYPAGSRLPRDVRHAESGVALILSDPRRFRGIFYGAPILAMGVYGLWENAACLPGGDVAGPRHRAHVFFLVNARSSAGTPGLLAAPVI